jgi:hypothetical protein
MHSVIHLTSLSRLSLFYTEVYLLLHDIFYLSIVKWFRVIFYTHISNSCINKFFLHIVSTSFVENIPSSYNYLTSLFKIKWLYLGVSFLCSVNVSLFHFSINTQFSSTRGSLAWHYWQFFVTKSNPGVQYIELHPWPLPIAPLQLWQTKLSKTVLNVSWRTKSCTVEKNCIWSFQILIIVIWSSLLDGSNIWILRESSCVAFVSWLFCVPFLSGKKCIICCWKVYLWFRALMYWLVTILKLLLQTIWFIPNTVFLKFWYVQGGVPYVTGLQ